MLSSIRPNIEALGRLSKTDIFGDINQYPMADKTPGLLTLRISSPLLCFANANFIRARLHSISLINISPFFGVQIWYSRLWLLWNSVDIFFLSRILNSVQEAEEEENEQEDKKEKVFQVVILDMSCKHLHSVILICRKTIFQLYSKITELYM